MDKNSQVTLNVKFEADVSIKEDEENSKILLIRPRKPLTHPVHYVKYSLWGIFNSNFIGTGIGSERKTEPDFLTSFSLNKRFTNMETKFAGVNDYLITRERSW